MALFTINHPTQLFSAAIILEIPLNGRFRNNPKAPDFVKVAELLRSEYNNS